VLFGHSSFPIITMISVDGERVVESLNRLGISSAQDYINQLLNMKFCLPDSNQNDVCK